MSEYIVNNDIVIIEERTKNQLFYRMRCNGKYILTEEWVCELIKLLVKDTSINEIKATLLRRYNLDKTEDEINSTIKYLLAFEVLFKDDKNILSVSTQREGFFHSMTTLSFKRSVLPKSLTDRIGRVFSYLFSPIVMVLLITCSVVFITMTILNVAQNKSLYDLGFVLSSVAKYLPIYFIISIFSGVLHEFGHIGATKYAGCDVGEVGFGIYFFSPVFYSHLPDINILNRSKRILVDSGGIFMDTIVAGGVSIFALIMHNNILSIYVLFLIINILSDLGPFTKKDGYWILSDITQIQNLHMHIDFLIAQIIKEKRLPKSSTTIGRHILSIYGSLLLLFLGVNAFITVILLPEYMKSYPDLLVKYWNGLTISFSNNDILRFLENVYYFMIILVPIVGLLVLFRKLFDFITRMKKKVLLNT